MQVKRLANKHSVSSNWKLNKWLESGIRASSFRDQHLAKQFGTLFTIQTNKLRDLPPAAFKNFLNIKTADRFYLSDHVSEQKILIIYFLLTTRRILSSADETFLIRHEASELFHNY